jgi:hypothetical protein
MRKLFKLVVLAVFFLQGCSKDVDIVLSHSDDNELGVSACLSDMTITRSLTNAFVSGHFVGVFVSGTGYLPKVAHYTFDGLVWKHPQELNERIYLTNEVATVYGFYPGNATLLPSGGSTAGQIEINIPAAETSLDASGLNDYMYASAAYDAGTDSYPLPTACNAVGHRSASLFFHHALSCLSFIVNKAKNYSGKGELTQVSLQGVNGRLFNAGQGTMDVANGTISIPGQTSSLTFTGSASINEYNNDPSAVVTAKALVQPVGSTSDISIHLVIDGTEIKAILPVALVNKWEAGKHYTYRVVVSGTGMIVNAVSIKGWDNVSGSSADVG